MTVKLLAMYDKPDDEKAFLDHYENVHAPLARQIPGLQKLVVNRVKANLMGGEAPYFMIAELHFADKAAFEAAAATPENRATGKDLRNFADGKVTLLLVEE